MAWLNQADELAPDLAMVARVPQHNVPATKCMFCQGNHLTDMCHLFWLERRDGLTVLFSSSSASNSSTSSSFS
jgi:hypothetical protein